MTLELIAFLILSAGLLGASAAALFSRVPLHSLLSVTASFIFLAGLYLQLNASFIAAAHLLLSVGVVMILFLFVLLILNLSRREQGESRWTLHKVIGALGLLGLLSILLWSINNAQERYLGDPTFLRADAVKRLSKSLPVPYVVEKDLRSGARVDYNLQAYLDYKDWRLLSNAPPLLEGTDGIAQHNACKDIAALIQRRAPASCDPAQDTCRDLETLRAQLDACTQDPPPPALLASLSALSKAWISPSASKNKNFNPLLIHPKRPLSKVPQRLDQLGAAARTPSKKRQAANLPNTTWLAKKLNQSLKNPRLAKSPKTAQLKANLKAQRVEIASAYIDIIEARTLVGEKLRFDHGEGITRSNACVRLSVILPGVSSQDCAIFSQESLLLEACSVLEQNLPLKANTCDPAKREAPAPQSKEHAASAEIAVQTCEALVAFSASPDLPLDHCARLFNLYESVERFGENWTPACEILKGVADSFKPPQCEGLLERAVAEISAQAQLQTLHFDEQLIRIEAAVDLSPVPPEHRGANKRRDASETTKIERATLYALEEFYTALLNQHAEQLAGLTPNLNRRHDLNEEHASSSPFEGARQYALEVETRQGGDNSASLQKLRLQLEARYKIDAAKLLGAMRSHQPVSALGILKRLRQQHEHLLGTLAQKRLRDATSYLQASAQPNREAPSKPAIFDEEDFGSSKTVGRRLLTTFLLPLELISVLLLAAMLGAILFMKRRDRP